MKRFAFFLIMLCAFFSLSFAQTTDVEIDVSKAEIIFLAGVGGFSVLALVEIIKRVFKTAGWGTRIVSIIMSAAATLYYLFTAGGGFDPLKFVIFTAVVALAANGIYLFPQKKTT